MRQVIIIALFIIGVTPIYGASDGSLSDTNIRYFGRWDFSNASQYVSYWGGAYFKVGFSGTTVQAKLGHASNYYVKIDNGPWTTYTNVSGTVNLTPTPLANGLHTLSMAQGKDYDYVFNFQGLILDSGAATSPPTVATNLIEFIGDSITAGYTDPQADVSDYAWVCSERLNCEHTQIAYPGVDLVTTTNHGTGQDVQYFKEQSFNYPGSPDWNFTNYTARVVVINLGQNDIGANGIPLDQYQSDYIMFLTNVRAKYPNADIFAMRVFLGFGAAQVQAAVSARNMAGDVKVHYVDTTGWITSGTSDYTVGDGVHPSATGHIKIANRLKAILTPYLGGDVVGKVTVGYQGWFSAPGDGSPVNNWGHINLEMWPDVREYAATYAGTPFLQAGVAQPNFYGSLGNGQPAKMFSSYDQQVVDAHFEWMAQNDIDCVALQRFCNEITPGSTLKSQRDGMALKIMNAAQATGRKFFIEYDASGYSGMDATIQSDWTNTIIGALRLTSSPAYAYQNGKPVVGIYGMGYSTAPNPGPGSTNDCLDLINFLKSQGCYVMGGVPGQWRTGTGDSRADFAAVYQDLDMIGPWAVGRATDSSYLPYLTADFDGCNSNGMDYEPNAYPGTSFYNSNGAGSPENQFPRNAGNFMWTQFADMQSIGAHSVFIAMFDEMNEATSIFKCAEDSSMIPTNNWFLTLDADGTHCSSDFYLRLVKDGGDMVKGLIPYTSTRPTAPVLPVAPATAPTGLTAAGASNQIALTWAASAGAASYDVKRAIVSNGPYTIIATNVGSVSYLDTNVVNGTTYYYVVSAVNSLGESANSPDVSSIPCVAVASASSQNTPSEGAAQAFDGSTSTKWFNANGGNTGWLQYYFGGPARDVIGYALTSANDVPGRDPKNWQFQGSQDGTSWTTLDTQTGITFASRFLTQQYTFANTNAYAYYRLNITANNGDPTGIQLAEMSFVYAAATPAGLTASAFSSSQITLNWTPTFGAMSYNVKRATTNGGPYTNVATGVIAPFYWDTGLNAGTTYYYVVSAVNSAGVESAASAQVSATAFGVNPGPVVTLAWTTQPGSAVANSPFGQQPVLQTVDADGNISTIGLGQTNWVVVHLVSGSGLAGGSFRYNIGTSGSNGIIRFSNLEINTPGVSNVLAADFVGDNTVPTNTIPNCILWLDAYDQSTLVTSGTNLVQWTDKSGTGNNATNTANYPVTNLNSAIPLLAYGGQHTVNFQGNNWLNVNLSPLTSNTFTVFAVDVAAAAGLINGNDYFIGSAYNGVDATLHIGYRNTNTFTLAQYADDLNWTAPANFVSSTPRLWTGRLDSSASQNLFLNGYLVESRTADALPGVLVNATVGRANFANYDGDLAEIIVYNRGLSDSERVLVERYLTQKWLANSRGLSTPFTVAVPAAGLNLTASGSKNVSLTLTGLSGQSYRILSTTNMALPLSLWHGVATNTLNGSGTWQLTLTNNAPATFYCAVTP